MFCMDGRVFVESLSYFCICVINQAYISYPKLITIQLVDTYLLLLGGWRLALPYACLPENDRKLDTVARRPARHHGIQKGPFYLEGLCADFR